MLRKRHTPEQISGKLREAEVGLASGQTVPDVRRSLSWAARNGLQSLGDLVAAEPEHQFPLQDLDPGLPIAYLLCQCLNGQCLNGQCLNGQCRKPRDLHRLAIDKPLDKLQCVLSSLWRSPGDVNFDKANPYICADRLMQSNELLRFFRIGLGFIRGN